MIRALRRRHRWMILLLALVVPALLAAALWLRKPVPEPDPEQETVEAPAAVN